jgi:hypothetical protein
MIKQQRKAFQLKTIRNKMIIEKVYSIIQKDSGKVRSIDLYDTIGNRDDIRYAISKLTDAGKIERKRGLGVKGVEYFYHDTGSASN